MTVTIDWENLGFSYMKLPYRYIAHFKNGQWDQGELTEDATLHISESSPSLHYGQQAFEGLKAYRTKDGSVQLFRPDENAKRLQRTCNRLLMPQVPTDMFVEALHAHSTFLLCCHNCRAPCRRRVVPRMRYDFGSSMTFRCFGFFHFVFTIRK